MPFGEEYSHSVVVKIDGSPLADDVADLLVTAYVDESRNVAALFVLRFSDPHDLVLDKARVKVGADVTIAAQSSGPGGPVELMAGQVTAIEREFSPDGAHTLVRGFDHSHSLLGGARTRAFVDQNAAGIARTIGGEAGLQVEAESIGPTYKHLTQDGLNDWEFLRRLADSVGAVVTVGARTLRFTKPVQAAEAPSGTSARQSQQVLEVGVNLVSLRATLTATAQVPDVEVRGWDVTAKNELVSRVKPAAEGARVDGGASAAAFATKARTAAHVESRSALGVQDAVAARATSLADRRAGGFAELDGTARGNAALRAGTAVVLKGAGTRFDGKYVLSSVRHDFDPELGYLTSFIVSDASERSLYGAVTGGGRPVAEGARGVVTAIVTNLKDPEKLGRVKVKFPVLSGDYESWWARTVQAGAGNRRGATILPEVNDEVLVAFGQGDVNEPYVLGGLYNGKDQPGKAWADHIGENDGTVTRRAITSRKGMIIEMVETPSDEKLTVSTNDGAQRITLLQSAGKGIEIISEGPVSVTAKQDATVTSQQNISVTTQSGNVDIKGNQVSVEATAKLLLKGAQVSVEGTASVEAKATSVKIAGQAAAELSASGVTTVRGSLVKIN
ncbi:VgrG-related protein [Georgenia wangjunii]|uniref:VgrG-related protein n=1 Tax=Georgenia wangjunii TaxID=3117730 RepID=UPI002F260F29